MAVWNPNNIVITNKGRQMLSYLQNGIGEAIITRVVVGSGRVNDNQLVNQTAVSNIKQEGIITEKRTYETGSDIEITITNTENTEAYTLNQIGIYAIHASVDGGSEFLYMLAQCDSPGDSIPLPSVTPIKLSYGFYLVHSNNANITITVKPEVNIVDVPPTLTSTGNVGEIAISSSYLYVCVAQNTWKKVALTS